MDAGKYKFAESNSDSCYFRTIVETVRKNTHYAGLKTMEKIMFDYNDVAITLGQDLSVEVNGEAEELPFTMLADLDDEISIVADGEDIKLNFTCGIYAVWHPEGLSSRFILDVQPALAIDFDGICGNCNGERDDIPDSLAASQEGLLQYAASFKVEN